jgi:fumarylacetoacetase
VGIAIGDYILDLSYLEGQGVFLDCFARNENETADRNGPRCNISIFGQITLNSFASIPAVKRTCVRKKIISLLQDQHSILFSNAKVNDGSFYKQSEARMHLPMRIGDFTDFMCSRTHVENVSSEIPHILETPVAH